MNQIQADELEAGLGGRLLKVSEAAKRLGVAEQTLWKWVYEHRIASIKMGRCRRIDTRDIAEFIRINTGRFPSQAA